MQAGFIGGPCPGEGVKGIGSGQSRVRAAKVRVVKVRVAKAGVASVSGPLF